MNKKLDELILECNSKKIIFESDKTVKNLSELHISVNKLISFINEVYFNDNNSLLKHKP